MADDEPTLAEQRAELVGEAIGKLLDAGDALIAAGQRLRARAIDLSAATEDGEVPPEVLRAITGNLEAPISRVLAAIARLQPS